MEKQTMRLSLMCTQNLLSAILSELLCLSLYKNMSVIRQNYVFFSNTALQLFIWYLLIDTSANESLKLSFRD